MVNSILILILNQLKVNKNARYVSIWFRVYKLFKPHKPACINLYTLNSHLLTLKAHITESLMILSSAEIFPLKASSANSVDPE